MVGSTCAATVALYRYRYEIVGPAPLGDAKAITTAGQEAELRVAQTALTRAKRVASQSKIEARRDPRQGVAPVIDSGADCGHADPSLVARLERRRRARAACCHLEGLCHQYHQSYKLLAARHPLLAGRHRNRSEGAIMVRRTVEALSCSYKIRAFNVLKPCCIGIVG